MFRKLRQAVEDALDRLEGRRGGVSDDEVDEILAAMRQELVETKTRIPELESLLESLHAQRERERDQVEDCVRRASQAEEIGDPETLEVAVRFAEQHRSRLLVIEQKIEATEADLTLHRDDVVRMTEQLKSAMTRRDTLGVQSRRARTIENLRGSDSDPVSEFERRADRMSRESDLAEAEESLDRELDERSAWTDDPGLAKARREEDAERLLRELKRRMGREPKNDD